VPEQTGGACRADQLLLRPLDGGRGATAEHPRHDDFPKTATGVVLGRRRARDRRASGAKRRGWNETTHGGGGAIRGTHGLEWRLHREHVAHVTKAGQRRCHDWS
jgi:hypothetical protein